MHTPCSPERAGQEKEADIRDAFRSLFVLARLRPGRFESLVHEGGARAWVATLVKI